VSVASRAGRTIYRASAGSGKTYTLTSAYLALVLDGEHPGSILATTFTRVAAGEILARVLARLAHGVIDDIERDKLAKATNRTLDPEQCAAALRDLVEQFPRLSVQTIDAFFGAVASAFAFDLGLPPGWGMLDDERAAIMRARAIETALDEGERAEMIEILRGLQGESISTRVHGTLVELVEKAADLIAETRGLPELWGNTEPIGARLSDDDMERARSELEAAPVPTIKSGAPSKQWIDARASVVDAAQRGDWAAIVEKGLGAKVIDDPEAPAYRGKAYPGALAAPLRLVVDHARAVLTEEHIRRTRSMHDLLDRCERVYTDAKRRAGALTFADPPRLLREGRVTERLEDLYYRLDARVRHVLLDEFQDTSMAQFAILAPILDEIMAQEGADRRVVCVGDPKQSLYSWRGAEPALMDGLVARYPSLVEESLDSSWRSAPPVLEAVNEVFGGLEHNEPLISDTIGRAAAARWSGFVAHKAEFPDRPGIATLRVAPCDAEPPASKGEREAIVDKACAARVGAILDRDPSASVGVLVRYTKRIAPLMAALSAHGIHASEDRGNPLVDAPCVAAAVAMLHASVYPSSVAAWHTGARTPLGAALGITPGADRDQRDRAAHRIRARCAEEGMGAVLGDWLARTAPGMDRRGFERFGQLIGLAHELDRTSDAPIEELVRLAQERRFDEPRGAGGSASGGVKVMTIHGAKGLEFDAVVLPLAEDPWQLRHGGVLVDRADEVGPIRSITRYPSETMRRIHPELKRIHRAAHERMVNEELCGIYVAMTRARTELDMIVPPREEGKTAPARSAEAVVTAALAPGLERAPGEVLRTIGGAPPAPDPSEPEDRAAPERIALTITPSRRATPTRLARATPTGIAAGAGRTGADLLGAGAEHDTGRRVGSFAHDILERVRGSQDFDPGPIDRLQTALGADPDDPAWTAAHAMVTRALGDERVRRAMRGPAWLDNETHETKVWTERPFAAAVTIGGVPRLLQGRFDRITVVRADDAIVGVHVVDYKTDAIDRDQDPGAIERLAARHGAQMHAYRLAAASIHGVDPSLVTADLVFLAGPRVIDASELD